MEDGNNKVELCGMLVNNSSKEHTDKLMEEYGDVLTEYAVGRVQYRYGCLQADIIETL